MQVKKLIEVAMPIKEISAESVRDKSIRSGHISTLHLWWARRPLPVCRAAIFASLVPDPLDENCPKQFLEAVEDLLGKKNNPGDPYKPYEDIPFTSAIDKMDDNLRNRLMMFIGKFSNEYSNNEKMGKQTPTAKLISDYSLIKSESKDNELVLIKARKLIWISYNAKSQRSYLDLINEFDLKHANIKKYEYEISNLKDRHLKTPEIDLAFEKLNNSINEFLEMMPTVFDPFAGGGAIPLEAARLGCRSYGNDINPVAHIIQKGSLEYPQRFGKPIVYSKNEFLKLYGLEEWKRLKNDVLEFKNGEAVGAYIANRLHFDVEYYAHKLIKKAESKSEQFYLNDKIYGKPLVYYWAKIGTCSNPSCNAQIPLLKQFYLSKRRTAGENNWVYLNPVITGNIVSFEIQKGKFDQDGWIARGNLLCPCCGNATDVTTLKNQFINGKTTEKILAVIFEKDGERYYRLPNEEENQISENIPRLSNAPIESMPTKYTQALPSCTWGISKWGDLFNNRQLLTINNFVESVNEVVDNIEEGEYKSSIVLYLSILIDRILARSTSFGVWHTLQETVEHPFGRQAIPMIFDYPEMNPFGELSGAAIGQLSSILKYLNSENGTFWSICNNASSGEREQFSPKSITAVVTDPPYYDAIAYADLSDFFYVWLKRTLAPYYPYNFSTPQTPKSDECTALKHHHEGNAESARIHFENKLFQIFDAIEHQTTDIVSIMFAHQSTEAWTTLCNSILGARMNITGSWAIDTEVTGALKANKAFLSSSVTVSAIPSLKEGLGDYREVKKAIEKTVSKEVEELYRLGFRGADLLTACFGKAVSEFGIYEKVEKSDGSIVTVTDLLEMARESAFNTLLKGFDGDDFTKFYIGWLQLFGFTTNEHNTAMRIVQIGLSISVQDLYKENILIQKNNESTLAGFSERVSLNKNIGEKQSSTIIDIVHKAIWLYKGTSRNLLLEFISKVADSPESSFWRVLTSLCEILPNGTDDYTQSIGLLTNKESLIKESRTLKNNITEQGQLEF
jgi:adenine-specific DNA methylase